MPSASIAGLCVPRRDEVQAAAEAQPTIFSLLTRLTSRGTIRDETSVLFGWHGLVGRARDMAWYVGVAHRS